MNEILALQEEHDLELHQPHHPVAADPLALLPQVLVHAGAARPSRRARLARGDFEGSVGEHGLLVPRCYEREQSLKDGIAWFARNPVAANLMMVFIIMSGAMATQAVREEVFPELELNRVRINVPYLGAAPEEVESGVILRIEEAIQGIDGIKEIQSTASEGSASVMVELELGADARRVVDEVKNQVDAITTFPIETEEPIIRELIARNQVTDIAISGATDVFTLKAIAEQVRDELSILPEITQVDIVSAPPYEISIEVPETALRRHGMTFDQVADAVRRSSLDLPGGSVRTAGGEILLRTIGQAYRGNEYEDLVLWTRADGTRLRLGDVATVVDGFAETDQYARFDRDTAVMVSVFRTGDQSALDIAAAVNRSVEDMQARVPEGISLTIWQDQAESLADRLTLMARNDATGFVLVFIVLALFLEFRLAFWVSLGIPISFLGAIALMPGLDVSANTISLFAFILVLGVVDDDAIIVGENIFRHQESHGDGLRGSIEGAREIAKPVVFAVLTTVAAFMPLMFVPGVIGRVLRVIPLVVIPCLLFSLVESLGILPAHLAHIRRRPGASGPWHRFQHFFANGLTAFVRKVYQPLLETALRWRYVTAAVGLSTLILTGGMVLGGWINFHFFPSIEADVMAASVTMPQGTPVDMTSQAVEKLEEGAARLRARLERESGMDYFRHVSATVGDLPMMSRDGGPMGRLMVVDSAAANLGEVTVELAPAETRAYTSEQLGLMWREATDPIPEAVEVNFDMSVMSFGEDVDVQLAGPDIDQLRRGAVHPGRAGGAGPRLRVHQAGRPQPGGERDRLRRPGRDVGRRGHRRSAGAHPARDPGGGLPRRVLHVRGGPGRAGRGGGQPAAGVLPRPPHDLRPPRDPATVVRAAADHHGSHPLRLRRRHLGAYGDAAGRHHDVDVRPRRADRGRRQRQPRDGRLHQPRPEGPRRRGQQGAPGGRTAAGPPRVRGGRPSARDPVGRAIFQGRPFLAVLAFSQLGPRVGPLRSDVPQNTPSEHQQTADSPCDDPRAGLALHSTGNNVPGELASRRKTPRAQHGRLSPCALAHLDLGLLHHPGAADFRSLRARLRPADGGLAGRRGGGDGGGRPPRPAARCRAAALHHSLHRGQAESGVPTGLLWLLWAVLPLTRGGGAAKLIAFVAVLAGVGWMAYRGMLPRTRPIVRAGPVPRP